MSSFCEIKSDGITSFHGIHVRNLRQECLLKLCTCLYLMIIKVLSAPIHLLLGFSHIFYACSDLTLSLCLSYLFSLACQCLIKVLGLVFHFFFKSHAVVWLTWFKCKMRTHENCRNLHEIVNALLH